MTVFFFEKAPMWRQYINELGIQRVIDSLKSRGYPHEWPLEVPDPKDPATLKATVTASQYKSTCPHYGGVWLCGGISAVECHAVGEWIPGAVWYERCEKRHEECPFYQERKG